MIVVRSAHSGDGEAAQRVFDAAFASVRRIYRPNPEMIAQVETVVPPLERLVAEHDGELVGTVRFRVDGDRLRMIGLSVAPASQRRGIARALVERLSEIAIERSCQALALFTIKQTGNVAVFERLGFEVVSEEPDTWSISVDGSELTEAYLERPVGKSEHG
jgi:ribosomal protein S18 acetylase RimI-like enzyme